MPCGLPDGPTIDKFGPEAAPVNLSVSPAAAVEPPMSGTCGPNGSGSLTHADPRNYSESKSLHPTPLNGSMGRFKVCRRCGINKPYSEYYVNSKGNRPSKCKDCAKAVSAKQRKENPEGMKLSFKNWREENRGKALVTVAKYRAKVRGLEFNLRAENIQSRINLGVCELTGIPFDLKNPRSWNAPSLDRIDSGKGYTEDNVRVVLYSVNVMANTWGHHKILEISSAIVKKRNTDSEMFSLRLMENLQKRVSLLGSTLYDLTWKKRVTPAGRLIYALRASARRTSDSVCISVPCGWPTPQTSDTTGGGQARLEDMVFVSAWNTPRASDGTHGGPNQANGALSPDAAMCGWGPPAARDWKSGLASQETQERNSRPLNEQVQLTASGQTRIGYLLTRNGWEIRPASGQLNPTHSRWLMGLPSVFCDCAVTAMQSLPRSRRNSSKSGKKQYLPKDVEVTRASGDVICSECGNDLYSHREYEYPSGLGNAVRGCDGRYYHV